MPDMWMDVDAALSEVPVNILPLIDDTDFKSIEDAIVYNQAGMDLTWNFVTTAGAFTSIAVTPTTAGLHDWNEHVADDGMYTLEIPASGGTINNDTEGFGWFTGVCTGVLPWRGPTIGFRAAGLNNLLIDSAYSATRGLAGTALPDAAANAAGGLPVSAGGGLALDTKLANTHEITAARMGTLTDWIDGGRLDLLLDAIPTTAMRGTDSAALASEYTAARAGYLDYLDAAISSRSNHVAADIWSVGTRALTDKAGFTISGTKQTLDALNDVSTANLATALTDIDLDHLLSLSPGAAEPSAGTFLDQIMHKDGSQTYDRTTDSLEALRDTAPMGTAMAGTNNAALAASFNFTDGNVHSHVKVEDNIDFGATKKASIKTAALEVFNTDTHGEPGQGAPGETITWGSKIDHLYKFLTNKMESDLSEIRVYNRAGTVVDHKTAHSDDGTDYLRGLFGSGP